jgi:hypothetical protein
LRRLGFHKGREYLNQPSDFQEEITSMELDVVSLLLGMFVRRLYTSFNYSTIWHQLKGTETSERLL